MRSAIIQGLAALALAAPPAIAQNRTLSGRGTGSLALPSTGTIPLYQFSFRQTGGNLTLVFLGKNSAMPFTLVGTITGNSFGSNLPVKITGGLRDNETRGSGLIVLSGGSLASADIQGTGKQGYFRLDFRGEVGGGGGGNPGGTGAQPIDMSATGSGTYELSGRRTRLNEMRIRLRDDGRAELRFDGDRGDVDGKGTWRRGYGGRAEIAITEWDGRRTNGTGSVTYRGREIERVVVNVPPLNARAEFYPGRGDPGDNWGGGGNTARPVNTSFVGTGTFRERGRTYQLDEVSIRLRDNGEAELRFTGERRTEGRGRWTPSGSSAALTIHEWDGRTAKGSGSVLFADNQPQQVNVTLQAGRSVTFRSIPRIQPR